MCYEPVFQMFFEQRVCGEFNVTGFIGVGRKRLQQQKTPPLPLITTTNKKRGYTLQELTKIGWLKTGTMLLGLMSFKFC